MNKEEKVKKIVMGLLILVFFGFVFAEEKYEITEVDIFSLKKPFNSESITVRGVNVTNTLQEMMQILGKTDADLKKINKDWWLNIEPGFKVRAVGKKKQKAKFQEIITMDLQHMEQKKVSKGPLICPLFLWLLPTLRLLDSFC